MYKGTSLIQEPKKEIISDSDPVALIVRDLIGDDINIKEHFIVITLDGASNVISKKIINIGTVNSSLVHPRDVFRLALLDNAVGIIVAHNHPSGNLKFSSSDLKITRRLKEVGKLIGIELLDSVIVTELGHYSFQEDGYV